MAFYQPDESARAFRIGKLYNQVTWNNFHEVANEFHGRIDDWYIRPAKELGRNGHFAFPVMAINCLLIDTMSQFYFGNDLSPTEQKDPKNKNVNPVGGGSLESSGARFKDFLVARLPHRTGLLPAPISQPVTAKNKAGKPLLTYEDVLWAGFRCGILHQAHIPLYGAIDGVKNILDFQASGATRYAAGGDCPTLVCFPQELLKELETAFIRYIFDLWTPGAAFDDLRRRFKAKFEDSFGVNISTTL